MALQEIASQLAHLHEKPQIALLGRWTGIRALKDLEHANGLQVGLQQAEQEEKLGGIGGGGLAVRQREVARPGVRRHQQGFAARENFVQ